MKTQDILELIEAAEELLPVIDAVSPTIVIAGKKLLPLIQALNENWTQLTIDRYQQFLEAGMDKKTALGLTIDSKISLATMLNKK